jgi:hypothetical protein
LINQNIPRKKILLYAFCIYNVSFLGGRSSVG